jgi:tRNA(adenine34) deaminase
MGLALREAEAARKAGEVPIGCVIVHEGRVIGRGWNQTETHHDPTAHAEMVAITAAAATLGYARLNDAQVYVTVEPCVMCTGALLLARVAEVIYGAPEPKFGALGSRLRLQEESSFNHRFRVRSGVRAEEAAALLKEFFRALRRGGEDDAPGESG